jgi:hypothetical protein
VARERAAAAPAPEEAVGDVVAWSVWPARRRPLAAMVLIAGAVVLGMLVAQGTQDRLLGVAAPLFVLLSVSSFLLPTGYRLTRETVEVRSLGVVRSRPWSEMRRYEEDATGVFLSPFEKRSWLDAYRGVRLLLEGNRDPVVAFVKARLAPARGR